MSKKGNLKNAIYIDRRISRFILTGSKVHIDLWIARFILTDFYSWQIIKVERLDSAVFDKSIHK